MRRWCARDFADAGDGDAGTARARPMRAGRHADAEHLSTRTALELCLYRRRSLTC